MGYYEYRSAIVDELGYLVGYCDELSKEEQKRILENHPEYSYGCVRCECDGYPAYDWE